MAVDDAYVFPCCLTPVLTQLFFPKPPTTFFTCFCIGERQKYAGKKSRLNQGSNSQPPGHESDTLTTEPPGRGTVEKGEIARYEQFLLFQQCFQKYFYCRHVKTRACYGKGLISTPRSIRSKPLAAFPHDHCRNNGQR